MRKVSLDDARNENELYNLQVLLRQMAILKQTNSDTQNFKTVRAMLRAEIKYLKTPKADAGENAAKSKAKVKMLKLYIRKELNALKNKRDFDLFCEAYDLNSPSDNDSISDDDYNFEESDAFSKGVSTNINSHGGSSFNLSRTDSTVKVNSRYSGLSRKSSSEKMSLSACSKDTPINKKLTDDYISNKPVVQDEIRRLSNRRLSKPNLAFYGRSEDRIINHTLSEVEEANSMNDDN
jgi:hypothetical protein